MASDRFFDESKIIKKKIEKPIEKIEEKSIEISVEKEIEQLLEKEEKQRKFKVTKKSSKKDLKELPKKEYKELVKDIMEETPEIKEALPKSKKINIEMTEKPVYKYSKKDGKVNIETEMFSNMNMNKETKENIDKKYKMIDEMLKNTDNELLRLSIELDVNVQVAMLIDSNKKQIYENKTRVIQDEIKYNEKRKQALEKLLMNRYR